MMMPRPPWQHHEGPPRHFFNDHPPDIYAGPEAFMEAGARGFLVCTLAGKEEFGVDDAIDLLRQATIKLYGGIKPSFKKFAANKGYVKIDFMDPEAVTVLPTPEGEETEPEEEKVEETAKPGDTEEKKEGEGESKPEESKTEDTEEKTETEKMEEGEGNEKKQGDDAEEKGDTESRSEEAADKTEEAGERDSNKEEEKTGDKDVTTEKKEEEKKQEEQKEEVQHMRSPYKFKAFRTEIRNNFFIKSNVPDPLKVAEAAMEIIIERKTIAGDAVSQLLPVLGVCQYDYLQLEVMTRRVLAPILDETQEPKGFSVMLIDKLSEPGSEMLIETVRNAVWSVNPLAWQSSPLTEPDIVIRLELIGSKLVLCGLTNFMRYRHYSPKLLVQLGVGEAEDDDGTYISTEERRRQALLREQREKMREQERQREEERRKEREKRRAEAEARRAEAEAKRAEAEAKRRERNKEKNKEAEEGKKDPSKEEEGDKDEKEEKDDEVEKDKETKAEEENAEEQTGEEADSEEQASEKKGVGRRRRSQNAASPPKKKARVESSEAEPDEEENEEDMEESEEVEEEESKGKKKTPSKKTTRGKRAGRRKAKK